ncbi:tenascin-like isoform X1 [Pomacea canaliculata]|uniref:tenascin-like isoform X1 n=1 Tax=Pomacea canaliculata TaxID=400727 RepID=UPI000D739F3A|nr:tenascin-like isoform X1 [Pomacea canaliculata]
MLRFFIFLLSLAPFVSTKGTGSCQEADCPPKTWHNVGCSTDDDCDAPYVTCYKRVCRCEPGYFYTTHDTCTNTCSPDDMQDSFTDYPDSALRANLIGSEDGLTVEDCKDRCQTNKTCLTFDFKASGGLCRLHNVTAHESPSNWYPKTSKGWTHYQKSCKSTFASHDNWYNLLCNNKIDCPHPHSDCLSGRCLCRSGFYFNQAQKECVVTSELKKWHNTSCTTDDDCDAPHAECYKRVCRCEPGYFYTTHDTCTGTCSPDDMQDSFTDYPDSALRANLIGSEDGLTVEDCKDRCQTDKRCLTFDFKASGGLCRLHNVTAHESPSNWYPKTSKGWTHYQKSCKSTFASNDNWYNLLCNNKIDCHHPHSDCLSGRCLCHSGFHFNQAQKKCVVTGELKKWHNTSCSTDDDCDAPHAECYKRVCRCHPGYFYTTQDTCTGTCSPDDMQDSFTDYPDSALRENLIGSEDGLTVEDCKDRCQTNKRCLTFDFKASGGLCRLHDVTAHEAPSDWSPKTSKGWTHYQKSCKSTFASHDNWYNLLCNNKMECPDQHSDCLSGRCQCHFGFNQAEKKCDGANSCVDWLAKGAKSGIYTIQLPDTYERRSVWCDMDTAGGGWLVIYRRRDNSVDFNRSWTEYVNGFGNISGDYWLGLLAIYDLTWNGMRLRVDMLDFFGTQRWAEYRIFGVHGPEGDYKLRVRDYSGTAGDGLTASRGHPFQTYDRNTYGCVTSSKGAWWHPPDCKSYGNINSPDKWKRNWGNTYYLQFSEMKLKPTW